jgi:hypothetical protein
LASWTNLKDNFLQFCYFNTNFHNIHLSYISFSLEIIGNWSFFKKTLLKMWLLPAINGGASRVRKSWVWIIIERGL